MDCSIGVFRSRSLASCSAHPEQGRTKSNNGSELDHDGRSQMVVEIFGDFTLFDARIALDADRSEIYICRADEPQLRLSSGPCFPDWKIQSSLRTKTSGLLGSASLASLAALDVVQKDRQTLANATQEWKTRGWYLDAYLELDSGHLGNCRRSL
jgi:hypothetical protein